MSIFLVRASQVALMVRNLTAISRELRDVGLILGSRRSYGGGSGNPLQYSCLENPMNREDLGRLQSIGSELDTTKATLPACRPCISLCCVSRSVVSDPTDCGPPGFSVRGIFQARILRWVVVISLQLI